LASYCCRTGREQWRRRDLKKVQQISLSADGITAYCGREGAPLVAVDLRSGETTHTVRGARGLYESKFDSLRFVDTTKPYLSRPDPGDEASHRPDDLRLSGRLLRPRPLGTVGIGRARTMPRYRHRKRTVAV
jgi:hypothetical protein